VQGVARAYRAAWEAGDVAASDLARTLTGTALNMSCGAMLD
jgi:hypothetical protein